VAGQDPVVVAAVAGQDPVVVSAAVAEQDPEALGPEVPKQLHRENG